MPVVRQTLKQAGILSPREVARLAAVINQHCAGSGIVKQQDREAVAAVALSLYQRGYTLDADLARMLVTEQPSPLANSAALEGFGRSFAQEHQQS